MSDKPVKIPGDIIYEQNTVKRRKFAIAVFLFILFESCCVTLKTCPISYKVLASWSINLTLEKMQLFPKYVYTKTGNFVNLTNFAFE